jgi:fatty-acid peroxygenase
MSFPSDPSFDSTLALRREGYAFGRHRFERLETDAFRTRLMLRPAYFVRGREAARVFYTPGRFTRRRAMPPTTFRLLQDKGSVQTLEGAAHRRRKALFLALLGPGREGEAGRHFDAEWDAQLARWEASGRIVFHEEMQRLLCRTACAWAGVPLAEKAVAGRTREFASMIEGAGSAGPRAWRALVLRQRTEHWARGLIRAVRDGDLAVREDQPLAVLAHHPDDKGELLTPRVAGVELLNLLRPTVAIARYLTFVALALHAHPAARAWLAESPDVERLTAFAQEVRRLYPFFPFIAGRVRAPFQWRGEEFRQGAWMILDLHGTHHDPSLWEAPDQFHPARFAGADPDPHALLPQGGGEHAETHRCPGEWLTLEFMRRTALRLLSSIRYTVPPQDLSVDLARMPALPSSGMILDDVRVGGRW